MDKEFSIEDLYKDLVDKLYNECYENIRVAPNIITITKLEDNEIIVEEIKPDDFFKTDSNC